MVKIYDAAIYSTKPWVRYGDGAAFRGKRSKVSGKGEIKISSLGTKAVQSLISKLKMQLQINNRN